MKMAYGNQMVTTSRDPERSSRDLNTLTPQNISKTAGDAI